MKTAVVILNWNTKAYLEHFLPGLLSSCAGMDAEVIVADSASRDGSLEMLAERFAGVRTIALGGNYGFTGGYNRALAEIEAEYYVLINSDILVDGNWLGPLVDWMDCHPDCAVCGPKLHALRRSGDGYEKSGDFEYAGAAGGYIDRYGYPFCRGRVMSRTEKDCGQYDSPADVMWVSGACMMTRSSVWKQLGGLDSRFFAHMEEIDYCWRAQNAGWKVSVVPESCVWHLGGGTLPQTSAWKLQLNYRNNLLLLDNNLAVTIGQGKAAARIAFRKCLDLASAAVYAVTGRSEYAKAVLTAHKEYRSLRSRKPTAAGSSKASGYSDICIILQSIIRGDRIFEYLRRR